MRSGTSAPLGIVIRSLPTAESLTVNFGRDCQEMRNWREGIKAMHWMTRFAVTAAAAALSVGLLAKRIHVPDTVWAALIAAGVAFFTTTLSNSNSRKQLRMQLNSNALQQDRERAMALRRDVYLPAAEALARCQGALGRLSSMKADQEAIAQQLVADIATLSKIHLVAGESTIIALMAYQKALMPAYIELLELRAPMLNRQRAIDQQQSFMDAAIAEHKQIVHLMREHNISGNPDAARLDRLKLQGQNLLKRHNEYNEQQTALGKEQFAAQLKISEKLTAMLAKTAALIPEALLSARHDFELPIDDAKYRILYGEQQEAALNMMRGVIQRARNPNPPSPPAPPDQPQT
jgi:hypothetical protein